MTDPAPNPPPADDADLVDAFHLARYRKMIAALAIGLIGWGAQVVTSDPTAVTAGEWVGLATVAAVTVGVGAVLNKGQ